jgi:hypothetical protein
VAEISHPESPSAAVVRAGHGRLARAASQWRVNIEQQAIQRVSGAVPDQFMSALEEKLAQAEFWHSQKRRK